VAASAAERTIDRRAERYPSVRSQQKLDPPRSFPAIECIIADTRDPQVLSLVEDDAGRVWTLLRVADSRWRTAVSWNRTRGGEAAMVPIIDDRDRAFDTVLEVMDATTGSLIASHRFVTQHCEAIQRHAHDRLAGVPPQPRH